MEKYQFFHIAAFDIEPGIPITQEIIASCTMISIVLIKPTRQFIYTNLSNFEYKNAFALGVMTFEGSVEMSKVVSYGGLSKILRDELVDIFLESNLKVKKRNYKNRVFLFRAPRLDKEESKKWIDFFAENTRKWWKMKDIIEGYTHSVNNLKSAEDILNSVFATRLTSLTELLDIIREKYSNKNINSHILKKEINMSKEKLRLFTNFLTEMNILIRKTYNGYYYNPDIKSWKLPYRPWFEGCYLKCQ